MLKYSIPSAVSVHIFTIYIDAYFRFLEKYVFDCQWFYFVLDILQYDDLLLYNGEFSKFTPPPQIITFKYKIKTHIILYIHQPYALFFWL
jgi:hypothetical protein